MKTFDVGKMNKALKGFSEVIRFDLRADAHRTGFELALTLANEKDERLTLTCHDVQNLELNPAGTGFEPMLRLEVTDMREDGLERIWFSLEELERETLFLHCAGIELKEAKA